MAYSRLLIAVLLMVTCSWQLTFAQQTDTTPPDTFDAFDFLEDELAEKSDPRDVAEVALEGRPFVPRWSGVASPDDPQAILRSWGVQESPGSESAVGYASEPTQSEPSPSPASSDTEETQFHQTPGHPFSSIPPEGGDEQEFSVSGPTDDEIGVVPALAQDIEWANPSITDLYLPDREFHEFPSGDVLRTRYSSLFRSDWKPNPAHESSPYGEITLVLNSHVERNVHYFKTSIPGRFQVYLDRFEKYKPVVQQIFVEFGLPVELSYLSLVESGFNPRAYSRARAAGPWQFMKATGRQYGLRVNWHLDERRDPVKSTVAAAHHLRDLYDQFGSWPLALAAYNAGAGKVSRAIRKTKTPDYWKIRQSWRHLRRETREYVPRFLAATLIAMNPTDYGFTKTTVDPYAYEEVLIKKRVHLRSISRATGISYKELGNLNPELRRNIIPEETYGYHLKVPVGTRTLVERHSDQFKLWKQPPPTGTQWYRVQAGDSLSVVAKRFGMSVRMLKDLNNRTSNLIRVGDRLRVRPAHSRLDSNATWYTVRYGDSLSEIAQRFDIRIRQLRQWNNLKGNRIYVGDRLRVKEPPPLRGETKWYRVRQGDSLWSIANRFSVSVTDLKVLNKLTSSVIRAGRLLLVSQ